MTGTIHVINSMGDVETKFDTDNEVSMELAKNLFKEQVSLGYSAFASIPDQGKTLITDFEPAPEIYMTPRLVGG